MAVALVLATAFGLKANNDYPAAMEVIAKDFQRLNGLGIKIAIALSQGTSPDHLRAGNEIDAGRSLASAMLLDEYAAIAQSQNLHGLAHASWKTALTFYLEAMDAEESLRTEEYEMRVTRISAQLEENQL